MVQDSISKQIVEYLGSMNCQRDELPLDWWRKVGKKDFPDMGDIAMKYLSLLATSVPCEQVFYTAGSVITKLQNCLTGDHATMLIFSREDMKND